MKTLIFISCLLSAPVMAEDLTTFNYHLGKILVSENEEKIVLHTNPNFIISIQPGGKTWPALSLDEFGLIYAGNVTIDNATATKAARPKETLIFPHDVAVSEKNGGFEFRQGKKACYFSIEQLGVYKRKNEVNTLNNSNIVFSSTPSQLLALVMQFDQFEDISNYLVEQIDLVHCKVGFKKNLGNPDLLVELNYSTEGGWWIAGSIEQTLLQSSDGRHWRHATLPNRLSSLISAYVVNPWEIWLAAILTDEGDGSPYLLVYSGDGGITWRNVLLNDPILQRMPVGWLEGQKRRVLH